MIRYDPILLGATETEEEISPAMQDIMELERLSAIQQSEQDAENARRLETVKTFFGLGKEAVADITKKKAETDGAGAPTTQIITIPGTNINAAALVIPAVILGGVLLLTAKRRR